MDLLKTPSIQSLLDSDLESVESLQCMDIEELDEIEYALPATETDITLADVLNSEDEEGLDKEKKNKTQAVQEPASGSALQVDFLQGVSQQLLQAQERSAAGAATSLTAGASGQLTVGTAHGHVLSFSEQILRWVCDLNADNGAVSCLAYNKESTRILVGYARGLICQYDSSVGQILRKLTLGGEIWGILRVTWAGTSGLALDTGGSVWLMKYSRPLGVRSAKTSCLFSGARGEVVAMAAQNARILALATLSRVIIVAGGRAAGVKLSGPPDTLPVLAWCEADDRLLVCARATTLQWLTIEVTGSAISLRPIRRFELSTAPLWLGWVGGGLAIFDVNENLRLWGEDYDKPLDLSQIEPVYASAFFKGVWTEGRVSLALSAAGAGALGGAASGGGALVLLGRRGVVRARARDPLARARALFAAARPLPALRMLVASAARPAARELAQQLLSDISDAPHLLRDKAVANETVKMCLKFDLSVELWSTVWEQCAGESTFVEALGEAAARGELAGAPPDPQASQGLIERLAVCDPALVERVVTSLPLTSLDPHSASVFLRERGLWRAVGAIAATLGGASGGMRELTKYVAAGCYDEGSAACRCAGDALLLLAADGLAGRAAAGRDMPDHARPSARHSALQTLLTEEVLDLLRRGLGDALLLLAADGLAGRAAAGRDMPDHSRPSARHSALQTLLTKEVLDLLRRGLGDALLLLAADGLVGRAAAGRDMLDHARPSARHSALQTLLTKEVLDLLRRGLGDALLLLAADGLAGRAAAGRDMLDHARPSARHSALQTLLTKEVLDLLRRGLGDALLLLAADGLAGRAAAGRDMPDHSRPSARHSALQTLLTELVLDLLRRGLGDALLLLAADGLAGRAAAGRDMLDHARPSARHIALQTLLTEEMRGGQVISPAPLRILVQHEARSALRLLEQSWRDPPFVGPLGKQNRLKATRALLLYCVELPDDQRIEIVEFIANQLNCGGVPADRELRAGAANLAAGVPGERADRALLALGAECQPLNDTPSAPNDTPRALNDTPSATNDTPGAPNDTPSALNVTPITTNGTPSAPDDRPSATNDTTSASNDTARALIESTTAPNVAPSASVGQSTTHPRPRLLWRHHASRLQDQLALRHFFTIADRSKTDIDELFEYLQSRVKDRDAIKPSIEKFLPSLIALRPRAMAAILRDNFPEIVSDALSATSEQPMMELAEFLLETGALQGDAAAVYLRHLCSRCPDKVNAFLLNNPGVVRPEEALAIIRSAGLREAEASCLEAAGDVEAALDVLLELVAASEGDDEEECRLVESACALCSRCAPAAPRAAAAALWTRLLSAARRLPPGALLDAAAHVPLAASLARACDSPAVAAAVARAARDHAALWACAATVLKRELHRAGARAMKEAGRGVAVRGVQCLACGAALSSRAARVLVCAHGTFPSHADCPPAACPACPHDAPRRHVALPARPTRQPIEMEHDLLLVAPPRPDLEGIV